MFKSRTNTVGIIVALLLLFSCGEGNRSLEGDLVGRWQGTMAELQIQPFGIPLPVSRKDESFSSTIEFRSDGTVTLNQGREQMNGTYELAGERITTDLALSVEGISLPRTYTIEDLTESDLVFFMEKKDTTLTDPETGRSVSGDVKITLHFMKK